MDGLGCGGDVGWWSVEGDAVFGIRRFQPATKRCVFAGTATEREQLESEEEEEAEKETRSLVVAMEPLPLSSILDRFAPNHDLPLRLMMSGCSLARAGASHRLLRTRMEMMY